MQVRGARLTLVWLHVWRYRGGSALFNTLDSSVNQERRREGRVPLDRWHSFRKWRQILIIFVSLAWLEWEEMFRFLPAKSKSHCRGQICFCFPPSDPEIRPPIPLMTHLHLRSDWGVTGQLQLHRRLDGLPKLLLCLKGCIPLPAWV